MTRFKKRKQILYVVILLIFSISFNQYYGNIGIFPEDSFLIFNSGYEALIGYFPFKDYWATTGPLLDIIQAFFFKIFGISWFSYVLHASIINFIITIATFYTLTKFRLNINYCFFYSFLVAILAYPTAGTPFMDHHSTFLSVVALFTFILALKTKLNFYWFVLPIILGLAFLSKQVPASYVFLIIVILSIIHFSFKFDTKKFFLGFLSASLFVVTFLLIMKLGNISLISFFEQYFFFPQSLGKARLNLLFPLEFNRIILRYKLIHLSLLILIIVSIKKIIEDYRYLKNDEFLIIVSLISTSFALIITQLMTINDKFIFFIIPILTGFSHIYYKKYFERKNYILYFLIFLSISSTFWYYYNYIDSRRFMSLDRTMIENAVDARILDKKLAGLKWISYNYPEDPEKEISQLKEVIKIIKKDNRNKTIITDYQFISVLMSSYDYSPNKVWHSGHNYPFPASSTPPLMNSSKQYKDFKIYRKFFIKKLNENKIKVIYVIKPFWGEGNRAGIILRPILDDNCLKKSVLTDILDRYLILQCKDLKY